MRFVLQRASGLRRLTLPEVDIEETDEQQQQRGGRGLKQDDDDVTGSASSTAERSESTGTENLDGTLINVCIDDTMFPR